MEKRVEKLNPSIGDSAEQMTKANVPMLPAGPCPRCKGYHETDVPYCTYCGRDAAGGWTTPEWIKNHFRAQ
jgi:hypothetical protein